MPLLPRKNKGFSLVELLVVITIIAILSGVAFVGIQASQRKAKNERMLDDLISIGNAMEQYKRDHLGNYPDIALALNGNQNILCFDAHAEYAHNCTDAEFIQGFVDNALLGKRYLQEVPTDPWTGSRYVYGRSKDGQYYQVAGLWENNDGSFEARTQDNLFKGFPLPSIVRAFDGPNFVVQRGSFLPYSANALELTATARNVTGIVSVIPASGGNPNTIASGALLTQGMTVTTGANPAGSLDLYFSDGSVTSLTAGTSLQLKNLTVAKNPQDNSIFTQITTHLSLGKIWNKVVRLSQNSQFNVETTSAIAGVRGTEFGVEATAGGSPVYQVRSGKIEVKDTLGTEAVADDTLLGFVDSNLTDPAENDDVAGPQSAVIAGGSLSIQDMTLDENTAVQDDFYNPLALTNNVVPHLLGVAGRDITVENLYPTLGLDPADTRLASIPITIMGEYTANDGQVLALPPTGFEDAKNGIGANYTVSVAGDYRKVRLRFEKYNSARPTPGENPFEVSAWSSPAVDINTGASLSGADLAAPGSARTPSLSIPSDLAYAWDSISAVFIPLTLNNFDWTTATATSPSYTGTVSSGGCTLGDGASNILTAANSRIQITPSAAGVCTVTDFAVTLPDGTRLSLGTFAVNIRTVSTGELSSDVTGATPSLTDIRQSDVSDTALTLNFRVDMVDYTGGSVAITNSAGATLTTVPIRDGRGLVDYATIPPITIAGSGLAPGGASNTVRLRLTYSAPVGATVARGGTIDTTFPITLGRPTVTSLRFRPGPTSLTVGGALDGTLPIVIETVSTNRGSLSSPVPSADFTCTSSNLAVGTVAGSTLTAVGAGTLTLTCTINPDPGTSITSGPTTYAFADGVSPITSGTITVAVATTTLVTACSTIPGVRSYTDTDGCWVLAGASLNCDAACGTLTTGDLTVTCDSRTTWNDSGGRICNLITGGAVGAPLSIGFAPLYQSALTRCNERTGTFTYAAPNTVCNTAPPAGRQRICKCN